MTGRPGYRTMEMIGGSSASYLARTPCVPLFYTLFNKGGSRRAFRPPGEGGDHFHCTVEPSPGHIRCRFTPTSTPEVSQNLERQTLLGGRFGYFLFFAARGRGKGEPEAPGASGGGRDRFFIENHRTGGGGAPAQDGPMGREGVGGELGNFGGGGLNIFFRGRNVHQVLGVSQERKISPKRKLLGRISRKHPGVIQADVPAQNFGQGPQAPGKTSTSARTSMTQRRGRR